MSDQTVRAVQAPSGAWTVSDASSALAKAYELADAHAAAAADWYTNAMRRRGRLARTIRFAALLLFGIGGVVPVAKGVLEALPTEFPWGDVGYIALAVGAGLLGFDHFFGVSSGYTRFVTAEIAIRHARVRFKTDWLILSASGIPSSGPALEPFVQRLREFLSMVVQLVERETQGWVAEFRSNLSELEKLGNRLPHADTKSPDGGGSHNPPKSGDAQRIGTHPPVTVVAGGVATTATGEKPER